MCDKNISERPYNTVVRKSAPLFYSRHISNALRNLAGVALDKRLQVGNESLLFFRGQRCFDLRS